jgi:hypothetical protein
MDPSPAAKWTSSVPDHQATAEDVLGGMRTPLSETVNA